MLSNAWNDLNEADYISQLTKILHKKKAELKTGTSQQKYQKCYAFALSKGYESNLIVNHLKGLFWFNLLKNIFFIPLGHEFWKQNVLHRILLRRVFPLRIAGYIGFKYNLLTTGPSSVFLFYELTYIHSI